MDRRSLSISLTCRERSVVVITPRCQRGNPGSNPGARIPESPGSMWVSAHQVPAKSVGTRVQILDVRNIIH